MPSDIIVVRGAPGSGKSSVARQLGKQLPTGATIEVDTVRGMIHHIQWESDDLHIDAIHAAVIATTAYLERGYRPVVLVDTQHSPNMRGLGNPSGRWRRGCRGSGRRRGDPRRPRLRG